MTMLSYKNCWYMWALKTYHIFSDSFINQSTKVKGNPILQVTQLDTRETADTVLTFEENRVGEWTGNTCQRMFAEHYSLAGKMPKCGEDAIAQEWQAIMSGASFFGSVSWRRGTFSNILRVWWTILTENKRSMKTGIFCILFTFAPLMPRWDPNM